jgi:putative DNA primase/helicase
MREPIQTNAGLCCIPLHVDAVTFDSSGGNLGRLLRLRDTLGRWKVWAMPMEMLRGDSADLRGVLLSMGAHLAPGNAGRNMLAMYLQNQVPQRQMEAVMQTGWAGGQFKAYALPDTVIGPQAARVTFQSESKGKDEYTQRGTLESWQQGIAAPAVDNPLLVLSISAAFAGPVLALAGVESGGLHLIGDSSTGKTTALQPAASVWGGDNFRRSWRTTANGVEGAAALFNDCLLALDELSECDPRDVGEVIYMLGNGVGKQRANRTGSARTVHRLRSSVISAGKHSIATCMLVADQRVKADQAGLNPVRGEALVGLAENLSDEFGAAVANSVSKANMVRGKYLVLAREGVMDDSQDIVMARLSELLINACIELATVIEDELNMRNGELQKRICTLETRILGTRVGEGL